MFRSLRRLCSMKLPKSTFKSPFCSSFFLFLFLINVSFEYGQVVSHLCKWIAAFVVVVVIFFLERITISPCGIFFCQRSGSYTCLLFARFEYIFRQPNKPNIKRRVHELKQILIQTHFACFVRSQHMLEFMNVMLILVC